MYEYNLPLRFQRVAAEHADRVAIWLGPEEGVTYAELNSLANRTARALRARGVAPGDVVSVSGTKTVATFATMLACLKIGAVYSMLDPDSPVERLRKILETCAPRLLVSERDLADRLRPDLPGLEHFPLDATAPEVLSAVDADLQETRLVTGESPAYVMFTSGSTGFPKGAVMTHANVLNLIGWSGETYGITPDDVLTNVNPLYFDNSVFDVYSALFHGARLVPFTKEETRDPKRIVEKVEAAGCSLWFSVPSLLIFLQTMKATDGRFLRSIRRFVFGGEGYAKARLKELFEVYSDTAEFHNVYGPTECTCICSSYRLSEADFEERTGFPPLGRMADNFSFLIVDEDGGRVADGEPGELWLGGPNVGKGYYRDRARTADRFVQNPSHDRFAEVFYRTGDLVRLDPADGKIHILGRVDNQVKHMGYRIELEEIETALLCLDYVSEAAALHAKEDGRSRILAVLASAERGIDARVREDLRRILPDYMIPSVFLYEDVLPKNANGKVDRKALAAAHLSPVSA